MFATVLILSILPCSELSIHNQILHVEIADTPSTREKGLMGREEIPKNQGMLFVFETSQILSFWMKNVKTPLAIGFFDDKKTLIETMEMHPPREGEQPEIYSSSTKALYALETASGWFLDHGIQPGMKFSFAEPTNHLE